MNLKTYWPVFIPLFMSACCLVRGTVSMIFDAPVDVAMWWAGCIVSTMVAAFFADSITIGMRDRDRL